MAAVNPKLLAYLKCAALLCLSAFLLAATFAAWKASKAIDSIAAAAEAAQKPIVSAAELSERVNKFITVDELKNLKNNLDTSTLTAQQTANAYSAVADETVRTMRRHVQPTIDKIGNEAQLTIAEARATTAELRLQIKQNGEGARALLDEGRVLIADSRAEVVDLLKELNRTADGLSVITNDPDLAATIENLNKTSLNLAGTTAHVEVISGDLEGLSQRYLRPLYEPKKRGFFGKLGNGALTVFRYATGASNIVYLIGRF